MKKATILQYEDLTLDEQHMQPDNGSGKEWATYILIEEDGERRIYSDAMEREDAIFSRDLSWIVEEINN